MMGIQEQAVGRGIRRGPIGKGHRDRQDMLRIMCAFDEETFAAIRARAVEHNTSFAEQVRLLVEWGLEAE